MDRANADISRRPKQEIVGTEQPVQRVGRAQHRKIGATTGMLVARQYSRTAQILTPGAGRDQPVGQRDHVAKPQIEPLSSDRMDAVGGIAHNCQPHVGVAMRVHRR